MNRRTFLYAPIVAVLAGQPVAEAQPAGQVYTIGLLEPVSGPTNAANLDAFRKGLRELGYVEGQHLVIEYRSAGGRNELFAELAAKLVRAKVDVIVTRGTPAVLAAKNATETIPIVMAASGDPLGTGVVAGLAQPGGNVTGFSAFVKELPAKRVERLKEIVPRVARIAVLLNSTSPLAPGVWKEIEAAARSQGVQAEPLDVRRSEDLEPALDTAIRLRADALLVAQDFIPNRRRIPDFAVKHRLRDAHLSDRVDRDHEGFPVISGRLGRIEWHDPEGREQAVREVAGGTRRQAAPDRRPRTPRPLPCRGPPAGGSPDQGPAPRIPDRPEKPPEPSTQSDVDELETAICRLPIPR